MPILNLEKILQPKSVAVVGASARPESIGHIVVRNLIEAGFTGPIVPINPKYSDLLGRTCYARVGDAPQVPDLVVVCTPAATVAGIVEECGQAGVRGMVLLTAGFREVRSHGALLEAKVRAAAAKYSGMRILGPNCLGVISPRLGLNASFASSTPAAGRVAFLSQSGALCTAVLDWALSEKIGFSYFVSVGNMLDVRMGDLIDFLASDDRTEAIVMYIESLDQAREFMSAARAFARNKPLIVYKAGRFAESAQAAASHTGAMAGEDAVYEAAFARAGIIRVNAVDELFDCAELLAKTKKGVGRRLAIVTNAGGPGVMATDSLLTEHGELAKLAPETVQLLSQHLPAPWSHGNPIDVLGDATPERFGDALRLTLADDNVDAVLVILSPQAMTHPTEVARTVSTTASQSKKLVLASWLGGQSVQPGIHLLSEAGVPTYNFPEHAIRAFSYLMAYSKRRDLLYETPHVLPLELTTNCEAVKAMLTTALAREESWLSEFDSKKILAAYGIPVSRCDLATSATQAIEFAKTIGYPVVMKVFSPQITHKTDVGGVALNLASDRDVRLAYEKMLISVRQHRPDAQFAGVTVQPMVTDTEGLELIVGSKTDPVFGPVLMVGLGGVTSELFQDRALELPPLTERLARRMLESLRIWPVLRGHRGRQPLAIERLIEVLTRVSYLVANHPEIRELDINPLLVSRTDICALDARVIVEHPPVGLRSGKPYAHLAIQPYPKELERWVTLRDATRVLLRPIRPEDEPLWFDLLKSCSPDTLYSRFGQFVKEVSHEIATRYCFIDYDREIAIVAETEVAGQRQFLGVGRIVADADHREAEFAVLVEDRSQGRGLGTLLLDYCLEIARGWDLQRVNAQTTFENHRMVAMFDSRGFVRERCVSPEIIRFQKSLN